MYVMQRLLKVSGKSKHYDCQLLKDHSKLTYFMPGEIEDVDPEVLFWLCYLVCGKGMLKSLRTH